MDRSLEGSDGRTAGSLRLASLAIGLAIALATGWLMIVDPAVDPNGASASPGLSNPSGRSGGNAMP